MAPPGTGVDPFPISDFDEWAETYDDSVSTDQFPFYGYAEVLKKTFQQAEAQPGMTVLDLGTGTGNLALLFDRLGCGLWCTDFSEAMLLHARRKLPRAHFGLHDLREASWPEGFPSRFDRIVSAYVFHHFDLDEKVSIVNHLIRHHLLPGGRLVIADVAFQDRQAMEKLKKEVGDQWEEEYYWLADEALPALERTRLKGKYLQASICAGVFTLQA